MSDNENRKSEGAKPSAVEAAQAADAAAERANFQLPAVDFSTFILSLASSALVQLGEVPNPDSGQSEQNLPLAKHSIDILSMLRDKTSCGLTPEETRLLDGVLYELRMKYVIKAG